MTFRLTINTDNAAFEDMATELNVILQNVAAKLRSGDDLPFRVSDSNGNRVGEATISKD